MSFLDIAQLIQALLAFGLLIFVHELGHFIAALYCGITVEKFSIGFGPALIKKEIRSIIYTVYVQSDSSYQDALRKTPLSRSPFPWQSGNPARQLRPGLSNLAGLSRP